MKTKYKASLPVVVFAILAIVLFAVFFNGLIVLAVWNLFHLANIVHLTYWQATGVALILGLFNIGAASRK